MKAYAQKEARLEEIIASRKALEKKHEMRLATYSDFQSIHKESVDKTIKKFQEQCEAAHYRNQHILTSVNRCMQDFSTFNKSDKSERLESAKEKYMATIEEILPSWKRHQATLIQEKVKYLEYEKKKSEERRVLLARAVEEEEAARKILENQRREVVMAQALEKTEYLRSTAVSMMMEQESKIVDDAIVSQLDKFGRELQTQIDQKRSSTQESMRQRLEIIQEAFSSNSVGSELNESIVFPRPYQRNNNNNINNNNRNNFINDNAAYDTVHTQSESVFDGLRAHGHQTEPTLQQHQIQQRQSQLLLQQQQQQHHVKQTSQSAVEVSQGHPHEETDNSQDLPTGQIAPNVQHDSGSNGNKNSSISSNGVSNYSEINHDQTVVQSSSTPAAALGLSINADMTHNDLSSAANPPVAPDALTVTTVGNIHTGTHSGNSSRQSSPTGRSRMPTFHSSSSLVSPADPDIASPDMEIPNGGNGVGSGSSGNNNGVSSNVDSITGNNNNNNNNGNSNTEAVAESLDVDDFLSTSTSKIMISRSSYRSPSKESSSKDITGAKDAKEADKSTTDVNNTSTTNVNNATNTLTTDIAQSEESDEEDLLTETWKLSESYNALKTVFATIENRIHSMVSARDEQIGGHRSNSNDIEIYKSQFATLYHNALQLLKKRSFRSRLLSQALQLHPTFSSDVLDSMDLEMIAAVALTIILEKASELLPGDILIGVLNRDKVYRHFQSSTSGTSNANGNNGTTITSALPILEEIVTHLRVATIHGHREGRQVPAATSFNVHSDRTISLFSTIIATRPPSWKKMADSKMSKKVETFLKSLLLFHDDLAPLDLSHIENESSLVSLDSSYQDNYSHTNLHSSTIQQHANNNNMTQKNINNNSNNNVNTSSMDISNASILSNVNSSVTINNTNNNNNNNTSNAINANSSAISNNAAARAILSSSAVSGNRSRWTRDLDSSSLNDSELDPNSSAISNGNLNTINNSGNNNNNNNNHNSSSSSSQNNSYIGTTSGPVGSVFGRLGSHNASTNNNNNTFSNNVSTSGKPALSTSQFINASSVLGYSVSKVKEFDEYDEIEEVTTFGKPPPLRDLAPDLPKDNNNKNNKNSTRVLEDEDEFSF